MREQLIKLNRELQTATVNAMWLYSQLVTTIEEKKLYKLNEPYDGLKIVSIWEAKSIAYRPQILYEYDFRLPEGRPEPTWEPSGDVLHDFFHAHKIERDARDRFNVAYIDAVHAWMRNPGVNPPSRNDGLVEARTIRIYEVKPC